MLQTISRSFAYHRLKKMLYGIFRRRMEAGAASKAPTSVSADHLLTLRSRQQIKSH